MARQVKEIQQRASEEVRRNFNLSRFKEKKGFSSTSVKFKEQTWIPVSKAFQDTTSLPGIPVGHITLLRGYSDTGKTTALLEAAASCQKMGILPVFLITEMKFDFSYAKGLGLQFTEKVDPETGEVVDYEGFFLYADRSTLNSIEDVAAYVADLLDEQANGKLPFDLCFLWDSIGSIPCKMSIESKNNSNMWNANAMSTQFGGFINQRIVLSRKLSSPYTSTLVAINKVWTSPPETFMSQPKLQNKYGNAMYFDSSLVVTFGGVSNSGTTKLKVVAGGKEFEWGKRTKVAVDKCHINGIVTSRGYLAMTPTGFISADPKEIERYKNEHKKEWAEQLSVSTEALAFEEEEILSETITEE